MTFDQTLLELMRGHRVRRPGKRVLRLVRGKKIEGEEAYLVDYDGGGHAVIHSPTTILADRMVWVPQIDQLLADDWEVVE